MELGQIKELLLWIDGNSRFGGCMPRSIEARGILDLRNCGSPVDESDRAVLVSLYHTTGGDNYWDSQNWLGNVVMDEWIGVATDPDGRVTGLRLGGNRPAGALPVELGHLPNLRELVLTDNRLRGSIPSELETLGSLRQLWLAGNPKLTGCIPSLWLGGRCRFSAGACG